MILRASCLHPFQLRLKSLFSSKASFPLQGKLASAAVGLLPMPKRSSAQHWVVLILVKGQ